MIKTTLKIDGMMCGMCESHMNDAIRKAFSVKKVSSSHSKGETVVTSEKPLEEAKVKEVVTSLGYTLQDMKVDTAEKKHFWQR